MKLTFRMPRLLSQSQPLGTDRNRSCTPTTALAFSEDADGGAGEHRCGNEHGDGEAREGDDVASDHDGGPSFRPCGPEPSILRNLESGDLSSSLYYRSVLLDIFGRYVVGWLLARAAALAKVLITESCRRQDIAPDELIIHVDRGPSMTSQPVALLLATLGVVPSHSHPHVSNDNPFSPGHSSRPSSTGVDQQAPRGAGRWTGLAGTGLAGTGTDGDDEPRCSTPWTRSPA